MTANISYLEAMRLVQDLNESTPRLSLKLWSSANVETLDMFLRIAAAKHKYRLDIQTLPFNTLQQTLITAPDDSAVILLLPWDLVPQLDWRSGIPGQRSLDELFNILYGTLEHLQRRRKARFIYLDAPIPPFNINQRDHESLRIQIDALMTDLGATIVPESFFSLRYYLSSGTPSAGKAIGELADILVGLAISSRTEPCKVLVTDLDNTLWDGVIGEDGLENINCDSSGRGFKHYVYQTYLKTLKEAGVLLAIVSKNDPDLAIAPIAHGLTVIKETDIVALMASYSSKSSQIKELINQLNLQSNAFVFIDDNPVEIQEVKLQLPEVHCLQFPSNEDDLSAFLSTIARLFSREHEITEEDRERTDLYRRRLQFIVPEDAEYADLEAFLCQLNMTLTIYDRTKQRDPRSLRVRQLINKTNQFNLNGVRLTDAEIFDILDRGGRLISATLTDSSGNHGEVIAILINSESRVESFVMSCRVFQRKIEFAFIAVLMQKHYKSLTFDLNITPRNRPFQLFIEELGYKAESVPITITANEFLAGHGTSVKLFRIIDRGSF